MNSSLYEYDKLLYPTYLRDGNGMQFIAPMAMHFCRGHGLDVCAGRWPLIGAQPIDQQHGGDAMNLPVGEFDYIFSSHGLEHLSDPVAALEHWKTRLKPNGTLFLYLPHPDMKYWQPTRNRKHLHSWMPAQVVTMLNDLGFIDVIHSERDLAWSFAVVGFNGNAI